jgi:hypothetical protein
MKKDEFIQAVIIATLPTYISREAWGYSMGQPMLGGFRTSPAQWYELCLREAQTLADKMVFE